jgi:hypothetical protein
VPKKTQSSNLSGMQSRAGPTIHEAQHSYSYYDHDHHRHSAIGVAF